MRGHEEVIQILVKNENIDVKKTDRAGATALHAAIWCGAIGSAKTLIEAGA